MSQAQQGDPFKELEKMLRDMVSEAERITQEVSRQVERLTALAKALEEERKRLSSIVGQRGVRPQPLARR